MPRHPPLAGRAAQVCAGVGHQHQVLAAAGRDWTHRARRRRCAVDQEVADVCDDLLACVNKPLSYDLGFKFTNLQYKINV